MDDGTSEKQRRTHRSRLNAGGTALPLNLRLHIVSQSTSFSPANPSTSPPWPPSSRPSLVRIACHLPTCVSGRPGISLRNSTACSLRKNASEHAMGASVVVVVVVVAAAGWSSGAERHPTLPADERAERAETRGESDGVGALADSAKRSG